MKALVTGANGFIGRELVRYLIRKGCVVKGLSRNLPDPNDVLLSLIPYHCSDICDEKKMLEAMEGCDVVFHVAGLARAWARNPSDYYRHNTAGTETVLHCARNLQIRKVVFTSTAGVCKAGSDGIMHEDNRKIDAISNHYEISKYKAEEICYRYADKGLDVSILNPARVYGPGKNSRSNPIPMLIGAIMKYGIIPVPGKGQAIGSYAFIDDVAEAHYLCALRGKPGENYLLGGDNVSYNDFAATLSGLLNNKIRTVHIPEALLYAGSMVEILRARMSRYEPRIVPQWTRKYLADQIIDSRKAVQQLGYHITPLRTGLEKIIQSTNHTFEFNPYHAKQTLHTNHRRQPGNRNESGHAMRQEKTASGADSTAGYRIGCTG